jgi:hypothetical protein
MSRLCRLRSSSHGEDGKWAYEEIMRLRAAVQHEKDVDEAYKAEADALRKDADRYRWLRVADQVTVLKLSHYAFDACT